MSKRSFAPLAPMRRSGLSVPEFARAVGIGRTLAFRLIREGVIRSVKIGRRRVVPASEQDAFLARLQKAAL